MGGCIENKSLVLQEAEVESVSVRGVGVAKRKWIKIVGIVSTRHTKS